MDVVTKKLADKIFREGKKQLIFVRRVKSVREIKEKLDEHYNDWLHEYIQNQLQGEQADLMDRIYDEYLNKSKEKDLDISGGETSTRIVNSDNEDDENEEVVAKRKNDTFYSWYFSGLPDPDIDKYLKESGRRWQNPEQVRSNLNSRTQTSSTLLEINWASFITQTIGRSIECYLNDETLNEISTQAGYYLHSNSNPTHYLDIFKASQAAFIHYLIHREGFEWIKPIAERFYPSRKPETIFNISPAQLRENLELPTLFDELNRKSLLSDLCPLIQTSLKCLDPDDADDVDEAEECLRKLEVHRFLIDILLRTAHGSIDIYLSRLMIGDSDLNLERRRLWIKTFVELLEKQKERTDFSTWQELRHLAEQLDLIIKVNIPNVYDQKIEEYRKYLSNLINPVFPVFGASGETVGQRSAQARKFRMPGYPLALVSTDVFQEGEDLHTFCAEVVHYGLSGSPISIEQKIGRVDRVYSLAQRRLIDTKKITNQDYIQVEYPFISESIELLQVRNLCKDINEYVKSLHRLEPASTERDSDIDYIKSMQDRSGIPEQIMDFLISPYEVKFNDKKLDDHTDDIKSEDVKRKVITDHIKQLLNEILTEEKCIKDNIINAIDHRNFDALNHLHQNQVVVLIISARAGSDLLLSWTRKIEPTVDNKLPIDKKSKCLKWVIEQCWNTFHRVYAVKNDLDGYQLFHNSELIVGGPNVTKKGGVVRFIRRIDELESRHSPDDYHSPSNDTLLNILNSIKDSSFNPFDTSGKINIESSLVSDSYEIRFIFNRDNSMLSRKQNIYIYEHKGRCVILSKITKNGFCKKLSVEQLLKYTLLRNRHADLVEFVPNSEYALMARIVHPLDDLNEYEFLYSAYRIAVEADRLEYVLSSSDDF